MKINFSTIDRNEAISEVEGTVANKIVGGLDIRVDVNSIGITDLSGVDNVESAWANSSVQGIVTSTQLQSEANWNGGIVTS